MIKDTQFNILQMAMLKQARELLGTVQQQCGMSVQFKEQYMELDEILEELERIMGII